MCNIIINTFYISYVKSIDNTYVKSIDNGVTHRKIFTLSKLLVIFYTLIHAYISLIFISCLEILNEDQNFVDVFITRK